MNTATPEPQHKKVFVEVMVKVSPDGAVRPLSITFEDGITYAIDRVKYRCRAHASKVGGTGIRYTIMVNGHQTYLFEDDGKWFVEAKVYPQGG